MANCKPWIYMYSKIQILIKGTKKYGTYKSRYRRLCWRSNLLSDLFVPFDLFYISIAVSNGRKKTAEIRKRQNYAVWLREMVQHLSTTFILLHILRAGSYKTYLNRKYTYDLFLAITWTKTTYINIEIKNSATFLGKKFIYTYFKKNFMVMVTRFNCESHHNSLIH